MSLSQEFGDRPLQSYGLSGDLPLISHEERLVQKAAAEAYRAAEMEDLVTRVDAGTATSEEQARLLTMFSHEVGQGYN